MKPTNATTQRAVRSQEDHSPIRFAYVNTIPVALLRAIWRTYFAPHPFPNVTAYHVTAQQLVAFVQMLRGVSATYIDTRVIEYGEWIDDNEICAFTAYSVHRNAFLVLRRIDSRSALDRDLRHELRHVYDQIAATRRTDEFTRTAHTTNSPPALNSTRGDVDSDTATDP